MAFDDQISSNATTTARLNGMASTHRTFGYQPPVPMRRRYGCSRAQFNREYPKAMDQIAQFCRVAEHVFRVHAQDVHDLTCGRVRDTIPPAWLIAGTPWSSGIINKTMALPYHNDQANISSSWSAMIVARRQVEGGLLHLADYDIYLAVPHGSITIFDGQSDRPRRHPAADHAPGRVPLQPRHLRQERHEVLCADPEDEAHRAALAATMAEDRRATGFQPKRKPRKYA